MTPERAHAYRRVLRTLTDVGPSKLQPWEQARVREAADELIFSSDPEDAPALGALNDVESLCIALVESGRWEQLSASELVDAVARCGPLRLPAAQAA